MDPMSYHLRVLGIISLLLGPILLGLRRDVASAPEKFLYAVMVGPMVLIVIYLHYTETKRKVFGEADPQIRHIRLEELRNRFRTLFLVVILASILSTASIGWFLFGLAPEMR